MGLHPPCFLTTLFKPGPKVHKNSRCYDATWVEKLARGIRRFHADARLIVLTDNPDQRFTEDVEPVQMNGNPVLASKIEAFKPEVRRVAKTQYIPLDLDTIITGPLDDIIAYQGRFATALDPFKPDKICTALMSVNPDWASMIWDSWLRTPPNTFTCDMHWLRARIPIDPDLWDTLTPNQLLSYKVHVERGRDTSNMRVLYFHGKPKPHELPNDPWVRQFWH